MDKAISTVIHYGKQPSTWRGITLVLGALGVYVSPELMDAIATTAAALLGVVEVVRNESNKGK